MRTSKILLLNFIREMAAQCGGTFTDLTGEITSPGWPSQYPDNSDCTWTITPPRPDSEVTVS